MNASKLLHIIFFSLILSITSAQTEVFNYTENNFQETTYIPQINSHFYNNDSYFKSIFLRNKIIYFGSTNNNHPFFVNSSFKTMINYYDNLGELINFKVLSFGNTQGIANYTINRITDKIYFCGTVINQSESFFNGLIVKTDTNNNVIWHKIYDFFGEDNRFQRIHLSENEDKLLVFSYVRNSVVEQPNYNLLISILDTSGVLINNYYIEDSTSNIFNREVHLLNDSTFIISGRKRLLSANNRTFTFLMKYSLNQGVVWEKSYSFNVASNFLSNQSSMVVLDSAIFLVGSAIMRGCGPFPCVEDGFLIKTDLEGNEIFKKTFNRGNPEYSEFFNGIKAHPDGTLIVAGGTRDYSYTPTPSYPRGWLIKIDVEGNIIWERVLSRYHEYDWDDYIDDVSLSLDGGIALAGYVIHNDIQDALGIYHRNDAWLVKTDSCGFTTGDVPEPLILVQSNQELTIQLQNATQNYCTATLTWGDGTEEQIYAYSQPIYGYSPNLTHTYTQPGIYEVCIEALAGEEFRSYCTEVIIEPNSINSLPQGGGLGEGAKIFPNPTNNYFILEFPNHPPFGGSEGGYSLPFGEGQGVGLAYSPTGQLVYKFAIKPQLQQKIDISHLPEGVYIIKIETNQFSTSKKLVVVR